MSQAAAILARWGGITTEERFWAKVNRDGPVMRPDLGPCWEWTAACMGSGYGSFRDADGRYVPAHRFSWELVNGPTPAGLLALHKCDYKPCVNPDHVYAGTAQDNSHDMVRRGRSTIGRPRPDMRRGNGRDLPDAIDLELWPESLNRRAGAERLELFIARVNRGDLYVEAVA